MILRTGFCAAILAFAQSGFSQIEKGNFLIGGSAGYNASTATSPNNQFVPPDQKLVDLAISPNISYFVIKRLSLGLMPTYSHSKNTVTNNNEYKTNTFSIAPVARYYFPIKSWAIFPEVSWGPGISKVHTSLTAIPETFSNTARLYSLKAGIGVAYFLNKNIGVEGRWFYQKNQTIFDRTQVTNGSGTEYFPNSVVSGLAFNIGLQFYLGKRPTN